LPFTGAALSCRSAALQHGGDRAWRHVGHHGILRRRRIAQADREAQGDACAGRSDHVRAHAEAARRTAQAPDVSSLKSASHAAAPCPVDVKAKMIEWWGPILIEYYAGSEGNGVTVCTSQQWLAHRGSVGRAVLGKIKILDENDEEAPTGQIGVVYFADGVAFSYHNDPEKTKRAHDARGWSTLGDVGYVDADGFLYLTDRKSYTIISGGVNIYPQETEDVLITHPAVADVAVFGVPNEEMGEEVKAVVQPHDMTRVGKDLENELMLFCRKHLSPIKCPRSIDFETDWPRTPTGKLVKRPLRDRYWPKAQARA